MFSVSFFPLRQNLWPFFIFLFSYFLGACEPSDGVASKGVLCAESTANLGENRAFLGGKPP
jgi:hypothetical protein